MLTHDTLNVFAQWDTDRQAKTLREYQLLDTPAGDAVLGFLAGQHHERYDALMGMLDRTAA